MNISVILCFLIFFSSFSPHKTVKINSTVTFNDKIDSSELSKSNDLIVNPPKNSKVILGSTAEFHCGLRKESPINLTINWLFNKQPLGSKSILLNSEVNLSSRIKIDFDGSLKIDQVRNSDIGKYTCMVNTEFIKEEKSAYLQLIELPHSVDLVCVNLSERDHLVNVSWTPPFDGNSPIIKYRVEKKLVRRVDSTISTTTSSSDLTDYDEERQFLNSRWETACESIPANQNFVYLTDLLPARTYVFRIFAINKVGESLPSSSQSSSVTLPPKTPSSPPVNIVGSARSPISIIVEWQPPPSNTHNGFLLGYLIRFKLAGYEKATWNLRNITHPRQYSYLLNDLIIWKNYEIQVATYNQIGSSSFSTPIYIRTKEGKPETSPKNVSCTSLSSSSIQIWFEPPDPQLINGINHGYKVFAYDENHNLKRELIVPPEPSPNKTQTVIMNDLKPHTIYYIGLTCYTSAGDGPHSSPLIKVKTHQDFPGEVTNFKFWDLFDTSVKIGWSPPTFINGELIGYNLKVCLVNYPEDHCEEKKFDSETNETHIESLKAQTTYTFAINAQTIIGHGPVKILKIRTNVPPVLPLPPSNLAISNISPTSVVLQFTPGFNGNATILKWIVECKLVTLRNSNWTHIYASSETTSNFVTVENLHPFTRYKLRIISVNIVGFSEPSEPSPSFQTLQAPPGHPPFNVSLRAVSSSTLRLRWKPLSTESWFGNPIGYNITWKIYPTGSLKWHILSDKNSYSYLIGNLEEFTLYSIQIFSLNDVGSSSGSKVIFGKTSEAVPSGSPLNVQVRTTSSTTAVVTWEDVNEKDRNGNILGYKIEYIKLNNHDTPEYVIINDNKTHTYTLTELKKFTIYRISVCAFTSVGDGVYSPSLTIQTDQDIPGKPSNITFPRVTSSSARILWDEPSEPNGEILAYKVEYNLKNNKDIFNDPTLSGVSTELDPNKRTYIAYELKSNKYYLFTVRAKTIEGWGEPAESLVYTTYSRDLPSPPTNLKVEEIFAKEILLRWTPGNDGFSPIRYSSIQVSSKGNPWVTLNSRVDSDLSRYKVKNLKPFSEYQFRVSSTNDIGTSDWSIETSVIKTLPSSPDKMVEDILIHPYSQTAISVRWSPVKDWNGDEVGGGYKIQYCQKQPTGNCSFKIVKGSKITRASIEYLEKDQEYEIRVYPFNGQGNGPSSRTYTVHVGDAVPSGTPTNIKAYPISSTEVNVTWEPLENDKQNGPILGYKIFYWINNQTKTNLSFSSILHTGNLNSDSIQTEIIELVPNPRNSFILFDLEKWTEYNIQILAYNPAGEGPRSKIILVRTNEDLPSEVRSLKFTNITMSSLKVSWEPPKEMNGFLLGYFVTYETLFNDFSKQVKQKINSNFLLVTGLKERVSYTFKVRAETSAGCGPEIVSNVTTGPQFNSPSSVKNVIFSQTPTSINLRWSNPNYVYINGYLIEAKKVSVNNFDDWHPIVQLTNGRQDRFNLLYNHLNPSTQYTLRIMTVNDEGVSEPTVVKKGDFNAIFLTPSHFELRSLLPFHSEHWFIILCVIISFIVISMFICILCIQTKAVKYKEEIKKNVSIDNFSGNEYYEANHDSFYPSGIEFKQDENESVNNGDNINRRLSSTYVSNSMVETKPPPRPLPSLITYSDEENVVNGTVIVNPYSTSYNNSNYIIDNSDDDNDDDDDTIIKEKMYESSSEDLEEKLGLSSNQETDTEVENGEDEKDTNSVTNAKPNFTHNFSNTHPNLSHNIKVISYLNNSLTNNLNNENNDRNINNNNNLDNNLNTNLTNNFSKSLSNNICCNSNSKFGCDLNSEVNCDSKYDLNTYFSNLNLDEFNPRLNLPKKKPSRPPPLPPLLSVRYPIPEEDIELTDDQNSTIYNLNGTTLVINNKIGSRAPIPAFSSFKNLPYN